MTSLSHSPKGSYFDAAWHSIANRLTFGYALRHNGEQNNLTNELCAESASASFIRPEPDGV